MNHPQNENAAEFEIGDIEMMDLNQADRELTCIAVIGDKALFEYAMPKGSTFLRIHYRGRNGEFRWGHFSYTKLTPEWLAAINLEFCGPTSHAANCVLDADPELQAWQRLAAQSGEEIRADKARAAKYVRDEIFGPLRDFDARFDD